MPSAVSDIAQAPKQPLSARLGRSDRSPLSQWFWELDRVLLSLFMVLIAIGLLAVNCIRFISSSASLAGWP
jgi:hypothetical protein